MITVAELRKQLEQFPDDMEVVWTGTEYDDGFKYSDPFIGRVQTAFWKESVRHRIYLYTMDVQLDANGQTKLNDVLLIGNRPTT